MILVLSDLWVPFPGGAERLIFNLARDLEQRGERIVALTGYKYAQRFDGAGVLYSPINSGEEITQHIQSMTSGGNLDLILTHHYWATLYEREIMAAGVPVVQIVLNGRRLPGAALAVFISEWVRKQLASEPQDLTITPPAFGDVIAESHGDAIGFIKPIEHKGVELVYEIAAALPHRQFVILRGEWQDIEIIRPAPNIEFMEPVLDIRDFYARCRLVLMPSRSEDAGTVAQECAMNEIPCISSNVGGLPETNRGGIQMRSGSTRDHWVSMILLLDDPTLYTKTVVDQTVYTPTTQRAELELFHASIRALIE